MYELVEVIQRPSMARVIPDQPAAFQAQGENASRQDIALAWVRGVEHLHRLPAHAGVPQNRGTIEIDGVQHIVHRRPSPAKLRAALETTGSVSAIAARKAHSFLLSVRHSHGAFGRACPIRYPSVVQKIHHSLRKQNPHQRASYWLDYQFVSDWGVLTEGRLAAYHDVDIALDPFPH
jgi:hypothetical protein